MAETKGIALFNPELINEECCGYGTSFALDLLLIACQKAKAGEQVETISDTCPSCGRTVFVSWKNETTWWEEPTGTTTTKD